MSSQNITVVIADDHPILLKGLKDFLLDLDMNIVGVASEGEEALKLILEKKPSLAILDMEMPHKSGLEIASKCKEMKLPTKIILLTLHKELYLYQQAKELNLSGYILKEFALDDLTKAIAKVLDGEQFFSEKIFEGLKDQLQTKEETHLTRSEIKILRLIAEGISTNEIADKLFISVRTVEKHRSNMIQKLNLDKKHNTLLIWAQKNRHLID
ncbi:response regulator transcription factor [Algoriphagus halophytocola]|uniref:Response regulator transcription factor n=1 Tax=Algoriphagus halophytocola TaxID=2991499 RepID=A0ABY6MG79_9BACT|nr:MULTISPECIES: response regulator transcription factor [unclassified Algoriphagus]UZD21970.1 response regulator transcription factor [Algoriphagus sp. TR-M5]WBL43221.1 response regulator transcription factor [Algoriphagus sp. TR-M9]